MRSSVRFKASHASSDLSHSDHGRPAVGYICSPGQLSTEDHLADRGFWPTQPATSRKDFAGPGVCELPFEQVRFRATDTYDERRDDGCDRRGSVPSPFAFRREAVPVRYRHRAKCEPYTVADSQRSLSYDLTWGFSAPHVWVNRICSRTANITTKPVATDF